MNRPAGFLSIVGIGEDGVAGLSERARALVAEARLVVGGARHLALADMLIRGVRRTWPSPIAEIVPDLLALRPEPVAVLASGDPFCFGVGSLLAAALPAGDWQCLPQPSCLSLACARLGWAVQEAEVVSLCGRPLETLAAHLHDGVRLLVLSADAATPGQVARFLTVRGFGDSRITVLEALGGPRERVRDAIAAGFDLAGIDALNMLAVRLAAAPDARVLGLAAGLPDDAFDHDGQITKHEVRAATMAALAPVPGALLWDVGTGSGSVAIEWALRHRTCRAVAIDRNATRLARARGNAARLGVPGVGFVLGAAPDAFAGLPAPDAVFVGGGGAGDGVLEAAWAALRPGGRMVVNAVTVETEQALLAFMARHGGHMTRIGVEHLSPVGRLHGWRAAMTVTQFAATKGAA